jgi:ribosomal protein L7/L12
MDSLDEDRIARLERQVDYLFRRLGVDPAAAFAGGGAAIGAGPAGFAGDRYGLPMSFYEALRRGKKIQAIKIYREATGVGLKQAKDAVEAMARGGF